MPALFVGLKLRERECVRLALFIAQHNGFCLLPPPHKPLLSCSPHPTPRATPSDDFVIYGTFDDAGSTLGNTYSSSSSNGELSAKNAARVAKLEINTGSYNYSEGIQKHRMGDMELTFVVRGWGGV